MANLSPNLYFEGFNSNLARKIHDHCFGKQYARSSQQGRIQALDDIHNAGLADCHRRILAKLPIRANLVVPLLNAGRRFVGAYYVFINVLLPGIGKSLRLTLLNKSLSS